MRELRFREVRQLAQSHTANMQQSQESKPGQLTAKPEIGIVS